MKLISGICSIKCWNIEIPNQNFFAKNFSSKINRSRKNVIFEKIRGLRVHKWSKIASLSNCNYSVNPNWSFNYCLNPKMTFSILNSDRGIIYCWSRINSDRNNASMTIWKIWVAIKSVIVFLTVSRDSWFRRDSCSMGPACIMLYELWSSTIGSSLAVPVTHGFVKSEIGCWWQNLFVDVSDVGARRFGCRNSLAGDQHLKLVINTFRLQHTSPTSVQQSF